MTDNKISYAPQIFHTGNVEDAKKIILTPEAGMSTEDRWKNETPYLIELIADKLGINSNSIGITPNFTIRASF